MTSIDLFSSDLDGTLIGKPDATLAFNHTWKALREKHHGLLRTESAEGAPVLVYNSGRLLSHTTDALKTTFLPEPDFLICGVGTLIYDFHKKEQIKVFAETLNTGWDKNIVESILSVHPNIQKQPGKYQNQFKSSWYLQDAVPEEINKIKEKLQFAELDVNVIYSSSRDLDIIPRFANKGNAMKWLVGHLGLDINKTLVAGDTGNDSSMFHIPGVRGIIVENAQPELLIETIDKNTYPASKPFADGVLEGFLHYGLIDEIADVKEEKLNHQKFDPLLRNVVKSDKFTSLNSEQETFINIGYEKALEALKKNITNIGFSACSIDDNDFGNTDENYQSIWGRDGAITVLNSLSVDDPNVVKCQYATLETLLENTSEKGQVPSNVRIINGSPDYSGVGGIASIDSGLWLVIAFYHFCKQTQDYEFLRKWHSEINRIMEWLDAQDSNNDTLLEIPEAGDWMDLFGRSYNVLYDETLWYQANICHGRLAELLGDNRLAGYRLRQAQSIKETINRKFWPSIHSDHSNFADQQYTMGDTQYLLAEITPFNYDWRCDVYGNILAGLFNVLSMERSRTAFNFMWGVGVNIPFPVINLYPPVNSGDPHWRPYYTVNLLNLPDHYHNGGAWPFIGAYWVMFIQRLGLRDLAQQELFRLAEVNHAGIKGDWEFNEWVHGKTGRPMGKRYQAWSAAGYIAAYNSLSLSD